MKSTLDSRGGHREHHHPATTDNESAAIWERVDRERSAFERELTQRYQTLFVAYCHDRHLDPEIRVFTTLVPAMKWAKAYMTDHVAHPEHLTESTYGDDDTTTYRIQYELESDHALVVPATLIT
jgi:hypothetical protein